jgi:hypothetical protein
MMCSKPHGLIFSRYSLLVESLFTFTANPHPELGVANVRPEYIIFSAS